MKLTLHRETIRNLTGTAIPTADQLKNVRGEGIASQGQACTGSGVSLAVNMCGIGSVGLNGGATTLTDQSVCIDPNG